MKVWKNLIITLVLALFSLAFSIYTIAFHNNKEPRTSFGIKPSTPNYKYQIAGSGIIEASSRNIEIGSKLPGVVSDVYVNVGEKVIKEQDLLKLNTEINEADLKVVQNRILRAEVLLEDAQAKLQIAEPLHKSKAISLEKYLELSYLVEDRKAQLAIVKAEKDKIQSLINQATIRSPIDGEVLQKLIKVGERISQNHHSPIMIIGNTDVLHIRADFDEYLASLLTSSAPATAYIKGGHSDLIKLKFVAIEPFVIPKKSLTGASTERTDTRVLQVIYSFIPANKSVYVGQQVDVYVEANAENYLKIFGKESIY